MSINSDILKLNLDNTSKFKIEKLFNFNFQPVTKELIDKGPSISAEQIWPLIIHFKKFDYSNAIELEEEFKKLIALSIIYPNQAISPSGPVDMYWRYVLALS